MQRPIYFTSKILHGPDVRYPNAEKVILALIVAARKFRPYLQAHPIVVVHFLSLKHHKFLLKKKYHKFHYFFWSYPTFFSVDPFCFSFSVTWVSQFPNPKRKLYSSSFPPVFSDLQLLLYFSFLVGESGRYPVLLFPLQLEERLYIIHVFASIIRDRGIQDMGTYT